MNKQRGEDTEHLLNIYLSSVIMYVSHLILPLTNEVAFIIPIL